MGNRESAADAEGLAGNAQAGGGLLPFVFVAVDFAHDIAHEVFRDVELSGDLGHRSVVFYIGFEKGGLVKVFSGMAPFKRLLAMRARR